MPSIYSGIVLIEREMEMKLNASGLEKHIDAALDLAKIDGLELTQRYLSSALRSLSSTNS